MVKTHIDKRRAYLGTLDARRRKIEVVDGLRAGGIDLLEAAITDHSLVDYTPLISSCQATQPQFPSV